MSVAVAKLTEDTYMRWLSISLVMTLTHQKAVWEHYLSDDLRRSFPKRSEDEVFARVMTICLYDEASHLEFIKYLSYGHILTLHQRQSTL